jgi:HNH endonuclease
MRQRQRFQARNKSGFLGVCWDKRARNWCFGVMRNGQRIRGSGFATAEQANAACIAAKAKLSPPNEAEQFWSRVAIGKPDECWPWTLACSRNGRYGEAWFEFKRRQAHVVAFRLTHGFYPPYLRHSCDNGPCCNPAHLLEGTHLDNMRDKVARGRQARGETSGAAKLTEADVLAIRADPRMHVLVAEDYGVHPAHVCRIRARKIWRHI